MPTGLWHVQSFCHILILSLNLTSLSCQCVQTPICRRAKWTQFPSSIRSKQLKVVSLERVTEEFTDVYFSLGFNFINTFVTDVRIRFSKAVTCPWIEWHVKEVTLDGNIYTFLSEFDLYLWFKKIIYWLCPRRCKSTAVSVFQSITDQLKLKSKKTPRTKNRIFF